MYSIFLFLFLVVNSCLSAPTLKPSIIPSISPTAPTNTPTSSPTAIKSIQHVGVSEIVNIPTMGGFNLSLVPRQTSCPHKQSGSTILPSSSLFNGANVVIPSDKKYLLTNMSLLSLNSGIINRIIISNRSTLIFDDVNMHLNVNEIVVREGGTLIIGSSSCRILSSINITFHGSFGTSSLSDPSTSNLISNSTLTSKGLLVYGNAYIFGKYYHPTWTRLAATAYNGDSFVQLQEAVNWDVGQTILVTPTVVYDCHPQWSASYCQSQPHQNELRIITSISMNSITGVYRVFLNKPLTYYHYAGYEYQAEVALLSRNILFYGSQSNDNFGMHSKIIGTESIGQISGVQCENCGQLNVLTRYPFHFHMMYESALSAATFIEDSSVTNSNFRCYTVHGTNRTRLSRNVAYNALGMCYYFENGVEENNLVEYNLAAHISPIYKPANGASGSQFGEQFFEIPGKLLIPADTSASGFYFLNAMNTIIGNAASGGWSGFAFPNSPLRQGLFAGTLPASSNFNPWNRPLLKFYGNTAHSTGFYWSVLGSAVYVGGFLQTNASGALVYNSGRFDFTTKYNARTTYANGTTITSFVFQNTKTFLSSKGISHWGNNAKIDRAEVFDCLTGAMLFGQSALHNVLINVRSGNPYGQFYSTYKAATAIGFQFYDTGVQTILSNITFRNLASVSSTACAIRYTDTSDVYTNQGINAVVKLKFQNCNANYLLCLHNCGPTSNCPFDSYADNPSMASKAASVWDFDGSILNSHVPTIFGSHENWWDSGDGTCTYHSNLNYWSCPWTFQPLGINSKIATSNFTIGYFNFAIPGLTLEWGQACTVAPSCSTQFAPYTVMRMNHWGPQANKTALTVKPARGGGSGLTNRGWYLRVQSNNFTTAIDGAPSSFKIQYTQLVRGSFVVLAISYPPQATFSVTVNTNYQPTVVIPMSNRSTVLAPTENLLPVNKFVCYPSTYKNYGVTQCPKTGGSGLSWHFDGTYFYLRVVQYMCYTPWFAATCVSNSFNAYGASIGNFDRTTIISVNVTSCPGCKIQSNFAGTKYYVAPDIIPPQTLKDFTTPLPIKQPTSSSAAPSLAPSSCQSSTPSLVPSTAPSVLPSLMPSAAPSIEPSVAPSSIPSKVSIQSAVPTGIPSIYPSLSPLTLSTRAPSTTPNSPSNQPIAAPSLMPSRVLSVVPSTFPSTSPIAIPSANPSSLPNVAPSLIPSMESTKMPIYGPNVIPSAVPSPTPSVTPSALHIDSSVAPLKMPSVSPSVMPNEPPSKTPFLLPSVNPSSIPSYSPIATVVDTSMCKATLPASNTASQYLASSFNVTQSIQNIDSTAFLSINGSIAFESSVSCALAGPYALLPTTVHVYNAHDITSSETTSTYETLETLSLNNGNKFATETVVSSVSYTVTYFFPSSTSSDTATQQSYYEHLLKQLEVNTTNGHLSSLMFQFSDGQLAHSVIATSHVSNYSTIVYPAGVQSTSHATALSTTFITIIAAASGFLCICIVIALYFFVTFKSQTRVSDEKPPKMMSLHTDMYEGGKIVTVLNEPSSRGSHTKSSIQFGTKEVRDSTLL